MNKLVRWLVRVFGIWNQLERIYAQGEEIMSAISEFAAIQTAFNDRMDAATAGLIADVDALNNKIDELQNSPSTITPEDQALLYDLAARGQALATSLEALDDLTPPVAPTG